MSLLVPTACCFCMSALAGGQYVALTYLLIYVVLLCICSAEAQSVAPLIFH